MYRQSRSSAKGASFGQNVPFRWRYRICQLILVCVALLTMVVNLTYFLTAETGQVVFDHPKGHSSPDDHVEPVSDKFSIVLKVTSSREMAQVFYNGEAIVSETEPGEKGRGINVVVINQFSGKIMSIKTFDTYLDGANDALVDFLKNVHEGRIVVMTIKDEGSFMLHKSGRDLIAELLGSSLVHQLHWRDTWAFIGKKNDPSFTVVEKHSVSPNLNEWGTPVTVESIIVLTRGAEKACDWPDSPENDRRRVFCNQNEGYGTLCACENPDDLAIVPKENLILENLKNIPVLVMAGNRPQYLYQALRALLATPGVYKDNILVMVDGFNREVLEIVSLLGLVSHPHESKGIANGRICYHYKYSLSKLFNELRPDARYVILIEDDLRASPDFFSYFSQTMGLMDADSTLYCVSAWNDYGYQHATKDASLIYRVEYMPGLGWLLKRDLFKDELEAKWPLPENRWDWDMWMRLPTNRKGRECIIPDISRTFHFGASGVNMNYYFQNVYFKNHRLVSEAGVKLHNLDRMGPDAYEEDMHKLLRAGQILTSTDNFHGFCKEGFFPFKFNYGNEKAQGGGDPNGVGSPDADDDLTDVGHTDLDSPPFILFFHQRGEVDYENFIMIARCYRIWDLDIRGQHKSLFRIWLEGKQIFVIGHLSPYAAQYMPSSLIPFDPRGYTDPKQVEENKKA